MAEYNITIYGFDSGLNELLNGVFFNWKIKKLVNPVKDTNDRLIIKQLRFMSCLRNVKFNTPIEVHYKFYVKDKRHDRMNIASAFDKSFLDALQKVGLLKNDGYDDVVGFYFDWEVDKKNPRVDIKIVELDTTSTSTSISGESHEKVSKTTKSSKK